MPLTAYQNYISDRQDFYDIPRSGKQGRHTREITENCSADRTAVPAILPDDGQLNPDRNRESGAIP